MIQLFDKSYIIQNDDSSAMSAQDNIIVPGINYDVIDGNTRKVSSGANPFHSSIDRDEEAKFSTSQEEIRVPGMFRYNINNHAVWHIPPNALPGLAKIVRPEDIRGKIIVLVATKGNVSSSESMMRTQDAGNPAGTWKVKLCGQILPRFTSVSS